MFLFVLTLLDVDEVLFVVTTVHLQVAMANNADNDIPDSLEAINLKMNATTDEVR